MTKFVKSVFALAAVLSALALSACSERVNPADMKVMEVKLLNQDPPKHYYVDFVNIETGQMFERIYVSKHCSNWRIKQPGDTIRVIYSKNEENRIRFHHLHKVFCP